MLGGGSVTVTKLQDIGSAQEWQTAFIGGKGLRA